MQSCCRVYLDFCGQYGTVRAQRLKRKRQIRADQYHFVQIFIHLVTGVVVQDSGCSLQWIEI